MSRRVTILDVAARAGVGRSTVSRALANDPRCAPATRARIRDLAAAMGYVPDPALSALVAHRSGRRPTSAGYNLATVSVLTERPDRYRQAIWTGIRARAADFGYAVEDFEGRQHEPRALARMLEARGVRGVIWGWLTDPRYLEEFPWERFAHVGFLLPIVRPRIHRVRDDSFATVIEAVEAGFARGFERPGLALMTSPGSTNDRFQKAGWLLAHEERGRQPIPVWRNTDGVPLEEWHREHQPDLVIGNSPGVYWHMHHLSETAVGAQLCLLHPFDGVPGFDCSEGRIGAALVETLDRLVLHNELGLVDEPATIVVRRHFLGWDPVPPDAPGA